jgi:hypothetical protein
MTLEMSFVKNGFLGLKPESSKDDEDGQRAQRKEGEVGPHQP